MRYVGQLLKCYGLWAEDAGGNTGENGWREQSSMSQLLEKIRRAAEVFADPKVENEVSDDKKG